MEEKKISTLTLDLNWLTLDELEAYIMLKKKETAWETLEEAKQEASEILEEMEKDKKE